ncbi:hypothetical protein AB0B85_30765 [Micromonospora sp. NPDC049044]|uniref:hypothetical protein n=1 Tax=unclassified Micromonospora TaxID=2617518 RepID=UPI0033DB555D
MNGADWRRQFGGPRIVHGDLPLRIDGVVKPWAMAVGHSTLHLRGIIGDQEEDDELRVLDVVFRDVSRICVPDVCRQFALRVASAEQQAAEEERVGVRWPYGKMFLLHHDRSTDYVVAGRVYWAEVGVPPAAPSPLLAEPGDTVVPDEIFFA